MKRNHRPTGFTLIELLVVIAIVALLAGLLLPVLSAAKAAGRSGKCKSNLHQISLGLRLYVDEFNRYPSSFNAGDLWRKALLPYIFGPNATLTNPGVIGLFYCTEKNLAELDKPNPIFRRATYGYNADGTGIDRDLPVDQRTMLGLGAVQTSIVDLPINVQRNGVSEWAVLMPAEMFAVGCTDFYYDMIVPYASRWGPSSRHRQGGNFFLCDGHVEYVKYRHATERSDAARSRWNNDHQPHRETWWDK